MEAPLTANEFYFAITKSARNKAPGPDGLPIEYYLTDPHNWARVFEVCYSNQLHRGRMTKFQRRAHLSLLYKAGERLEPGNHRPLTLLNSDAKLGPKIMSYRLGKTLPTILHEDQHGFVPGRSIQQALFEFTSIQQYCKLNDVTRSLHNSSIPMAKKAGRGKSWCPSSIDLLLDTTLDVLPLGKNGWEKVESRFNRLAETKLLPVRDVDALKRKFILLKNHAKPTGDPECPVEVKRAKRIQREIDQSVSVMSLDGGCDEDENDDGKKYLKSC
ncbi:hypothetical protein DYB36_008192 [Aphanomyces astaci]|uniref:DUF6818 domain-containing protein n=1 Tax=Aphanomyces astaci TaxID=112090 RepID=A0A397AGJ8_APHAT|nr:hypothetical protein DYB36_008192 [Aphanomyces astaci]